MTIGGGGPAAGAPAYARGSATTAVSYPGAPTGAEPSTSVRLSGPGPPSRVVSASPAAAAGRGRGGTGTHRKRELGADVGEPGQEAAGVGGRSRGSRIRGVDDQFVDLAGDPTDPRARRRHPAVHVLVRDVHRRFALIGRAPGEQLEQHDAGGVDVRTLVGAGRG